MSNVDAFVSENAIAKSKSFYYFSHYYIINNFKSLDVAVKGLAK